MAIFTYKCPNCNAGLIFNPEKKQFFCEYCNSEFTESELSMRAPKEDASGEENESDDEFVSHMSVYSCPTCGAEIMSDDTTAATFCVYCHHPVILSGRLTGNIKPEQVIPFAFDKKTVKEHFSKWVKKRRFIKEDFYSASQMEKLCGVYFPFWIVYGRADAGMQATGKTKRVWRSGETEYTETKVYEVIRNGEMAFSDITIKALNKDSAKMLNGIYPYDTNGLKHFSMAYLSGFLAEKRNVERENAAPEAYSIIRQSGEKLLRDTISGYTSLDVRHLAVTPVNEYWRYALMPAWLLTYAYNGKKFYFAMNGQTGKVAGRVPVSRRKLITLFAAVAGLTSAVMILVGVLM
jgi:DNA-directed RNA polymerase subunit RPC12/RpoP